MLEPCWLSGTSMVEPATVTASLCGAMPREMVPSVIVSPDVMGIRLVSKPGAVMSRLTPLTSDTET